ncbi:MAG TPA: DUF3592 domain-containing protein [Polyangia bacterium]|jgi:hypothetical protein|nr:DUF3592 domain-containing protein [Polyangia bacterium]
MLRPGIQILLGVVFFLFSSFFVIVFDGDIPADVAISLLGSTVEGRVQSSELNVHIELGDRCPTTIRFEYELGGRIHVASSSTLDDSIISSARSGSTVRVEVWPSHPDLARIAGTTRSTSGWIGSFISVVFLLIGPGLILAAFFGKRTRSLRALKKVVATSIRDVQVGQRVKIVGRLVHGENALTAPLSGRSCACYRVTVTEAGDDCDHQVLDEIRSADFFVEDGSGKALVRLSGRAQLIIVEDVHRSSGTFNDPTPELKAFLERHGQSSRGVLGVFNRSLKYVEGVLEQGEQVAVVGVARLESDPDPHAAHGYREPASRLVLVPPGDGDLIVTDEPDACTESATKAA